MKKIDIEKIHTTPMGEERIRRNLDLQSVDVVSWCKEFVPAADFMIGLGKNWYVYGSGVVLTINASNFSVITARKISAKVREMQTSDYVCLPEFLYQAIYIPEGEILPPREMLMIKVL